MMQEFRLVTLIVLAAFGSQLWARAEDSYSVKYKENTTGDVIAVEGSVAMTVEIKLEDATGQVLKESTEKREYALIYTETVLAREAGKPASRLSRQYDKAEFRRGDKTTTLPYQGKSVLIENADGKYHFQVNGDELSAADAAGLDKEFNQGSGGERRDITTFALPQKPVAVGGSWMVDMGPVVKYLTAEVPFDADLEKAKGTGTLRKVYLKGDHQYGIMHFDMNMPVRSFGEGARKLVMADGTQVTVSADVDGCIDGTVDSEVLTLEMRLEGSVSLPPDAGKGKIPVSVRGTVTNGRHEQPKK